MFQHDRERELLSEEDRLWTELMRSSDALPDSGIVVLGGQDHFAHLMVPELLAREIVNFLTG